MRSAARSSTCEDGLTKAKRELLQAEVRLAKARAMVVSAEVDIKAAIGRLRALAK
jgi:outer membrane protein TolC